MTPFDLNLHRKTLEKEIVGLVEAVSGGRCSSFDHYKSMTGEIRGLRTALSAIEKTLKQMDDAE